MYLLRALKVHLILRRFEKGYYSLEKAINQLALVEKSFAKYRTQHKNTMQEDMGTFPASIDKALESLRDAFNILHPHRPLKNLYDATRKIEELAAQEKAAQEKRIQIKKLTRK